MVLGNSERPLMHVKGRVNISKSTVTIFLKVVLTLVHNHF